MGSACIDLQPVLIGHHIELRPLTPEDYEPLFQVANDPLIWEQHPSPLRYQRDIFEITNLLVEMLL